MLILEHRVVPFKVPCPAVEQVADAVMLGAKNIANVATFLMRNALTSYAWDSEAGALRRKPELHAHQSEILGQLDAVVSDFNAYWVEKAVGQVDEDGAPKTPKHLPRLTEASTGSELNRVVTHANVIERLFKAHQKGSGFEDYRVLPAVIAQGALGVAVQQARNYIASRIAHFRAVKTNPALKAGVPNLPAYRGKNERCGFAINEAQFTKDGRLPALAVERHVLRESFNGKLLDEAQLQAWNEFDMAAAKEKALASLLARLPAGAKARVTQLRCVPEVATGKGRRRHGVKWELVVEVSYDVPDASLLAKAIAQYDAAHPKKPYAKCSPDAQNEALKAYVRGLSGTAIAAAAGLDVGIVNHATLATTTGAHVVYAGAKANARWTRMAQEMDERKTEIYRKNMPAVLLQRIQDNRKREKADRLPLTHEERQIARQANSLVHADPVYRRLLQSSQEQKLNHLHQLSADILRHCRAQGVQVLVVGRNKGWKDEVEMGRKQNRLFTTIAHWQLIELLKYKGSALGILVVDVEESYTSLASFVSSDPMPVKGQETKEQLERKFSGTRKDRIYRLDNKSSAAAGCTRSTVHADLNGALNILRKLLKDFTYQAGFCLRYVVKVFQHRWVPVRLLKPSG